jgi:hypothetical protein
MFDKFEVINLFFDDVLEVSKKYIIIISKCEIYCNSNKNHYYYYIIFFINFSMYSLPSIILFHGSDYSYYLFHLSLLS